MTTVNAIALKAFNGVAAKITGVVQDCNVTDGVTTHAGRVIFSRPAPPAEVTKYTPSSTAYRAILQGLGGAPADGWTIEADADWLILKVVDVVQAGGVFIASAVKESDMWNASVSLQAETRTANGSGGFTRTWSNPAAVPCYLEGMGGAERWQGMRVAPGNRWRCIIAYQAGVTSAMRAVISGAQYKIESVQDMSGRGKWLELVLSEGAS